MRQPHFSQKNRTSVIMFSHCKAISHCITSATRATATIAKTTRALRRSLRPSSGMMARFIKQHLKVICWRSRPKAGRNGLSGSIQKSNRRRRLPTMERFISARGIIFFTRLIPTAQRNGLLPQATSWCRPRQSGGTEPFTSARTTKNSMP